MSPSGGSVTKKWRKPSIFTRPAGQKLLGDEDDTPGMDGVVHDMHPTPLTREKAVTVAACFLMDYEAGRPPSFSGDVSRISRTQVRSHQIACSTWWRGIFLYPATLFMFVSYFKNRFWTTVMHLYAVGIFAIDLYLKQQLLAEDLFRYRDKRAEFFVHRLMIVFLTAMGVQSCLWYILATPDEHFSSLFSSLFKPLIFFHLSRRARDALEAIARISRILVRVVAIELVLILIFAAVACRLYYSDEGFESLAASWLSLFQCKQCPRDMSVCQCPWSMSIYNTSRPHTQLLYIFLYKVSTTVVNPSLWMPVYSKDPINAVFFVIFIIVCVFYLHSLILSVVFQIFVQAATEVHERSCVDREDAMRCAYQALSSWQMEVKHTVEVSGDLIREALAKVRPHYGNMKMDVLMELVDPTESCSMGYSTFRSKLSDALNSSIRSARKTSIVESGIEMLSVIVTMVNFLFVTLLTSRYQAEWFNASMVTIGSLITICCMAELAMRFNICTLTYYPMTRLNAVFDTFAAIGAFVSCYGICMYLGRGNQKALNYLFTGRAVDMVRSMRFFPLFRDVVDRSVHVLPALAGPVLLVFTTVHVFVYIGMLLWGGQIDVAGLSGSEYLQSYYALNNFNTYSEGLVTVFNVMVVNDWHEIARVFLHADRFSEPYIVYPYFVTVVLIAVSIMLNVITAFFVESKC